MQKHTIDAEDKKIGRIATEVAVLLMGKDTPEYKKNISQTEKVEIINAKRLSIDARKLKNKKYTRHTHYPGGLRQKSTEQVIKDKGYSELLRKAVYGMLPPNKLRTPRMKRLIITE